jgi:limonene 1,2-monooxygenase
MLAHNWANFAATKRSYELFARHVLPAINQENNWRRESLTHYTDNKQTLLGKTEQAMRATFEKHQADVAKAMQARQAEDAKRADTKPNG